MSRDKSSSSSRNRQDATDIPSLKIVIVGDFGVGKTSLIRQLTQRQFFQQSGTTIGVEFKEHRFDNAVLQLWDIAGQQYCSSMTKQYYRWASAAIVVVDVSKPSTFEVALEWKKDVVEKMGGTVSSPGHAKPEDSPVPIYLFCNKADLLSTSTFTHDSLREFAEQNGFADLFTTTAREYVSVNTAFKTVADTLVARQSGSRPDQQGSPAAASRSSSTVNLNALRRTVKPAQQEEKEKKCCLK
jgi:Ras-related protein Rab-32